MRVVSHQWSAVNQAGLGLILFALTSAIGSQAHSQQNKVHRIGFLTPFSASDPQTAVRLEALRKGLRDLGYVENKEITIEYRYGEGNSERLLQLAKDLVHLNVEILLVTNDLTARAAKKATSTIPIVMLSSGNPIGSGVIISLARPGNNVTGLTSYSAELLGKRLQLLKEVVPKVSRFAFLHSGRREASASIEAYQETQGIAKALGVQFELMEVKEPDFDFDAAFRVITKQRIGALITSPAPGISLHRKKILLLANQNRIPAMHPEEQWANEGGLMSYGANAADQFRRSAMYVDKIFKGAKPADLPVEGPVKFDLIINLKTAKALNLAISQSVLYRADRVIK